MPFLRSLFILGNVKKARCIVAQPIRPAQCRLPPIACPVFDQNDQQENLSSKLSLWLSSLQIQERRDHERMPMQLLHLCAQRHRDFRSLPSSGGSRANRGNVVVGSLSVRRQGCEPPFLPDVWHLPIYDSRGRSTNVCRYSEARLLPNKFGMCRVPRRLRPGNRDHRRTIALTVSKNQSR